MGRDDNQLPAPRPAPGAPAGWPPIVPVPEPRVAGLSALLGEIDALRTTLQADLSLAAAALDAGAGQLAGELLDGDILAVGDFELRTLARLRAMDDGGRPVSDGAATVADVAAAMPTLRQKRRRRLPAAPLLVAAAALLGFLIGAVPDGASVQPAPAMSSAAAAGDELSRLAAEGAPAEQLRQAAEQLNAEVTQLLAASAGSPAAAAEALELLRRGTEALVDQGDQRPLQAVLAQTRQLADGLREGKFAATRRSMPPVSAAPPAPPQQPSQTDPANNVTVVPRSPAPAVTPPTSAPVTAIDPPRAPAPTSTLAPPIGGSGGDPSFPYPGRLPGFGQLGRG